ncbi:MAG: hypothetical protein QG604_639 [Candidatus Dependentiae bacterium]|nr:hypothetical protein [Candidatus Dependentiae bacterium]
MFSLLRILCVLVCMSGFQLRASDAVDMESVDEVAQELDRIEAELRKRGLVAAATVTRAYLNGASCSLQDFFACVELREAALCPLYQDIVALCFCSSVHAPCVKGPHDGDFFDPIRSYLVTLFHRVIPVRGGVSTKSEIDLCVAALCEHGNRSNPAVMQLMQPSLVVLLLRAQCLEAAEKMVITFLKEHGYADSWIVEIEKEVGAKHAAIVYKALDRSTDSYVKGQCAVLERLRARLASVYRAPVCQTPVCPQLTWEFGGSDYDMANEWNLSLDRPAL